MVDLIYRCIDSLGLKVTKSPETALVGKQSEIDSLGLVSLVIAVEQEAGVRLMTEHAMSQSKSPFRTIGSLAEYAEKQRG